MGCSLHHSVQASHSAKKSPDFTPPLGASGFAGAQRGDRKHARNCHTVNNTATDNAA